MAEVYGGRPSEWLGVPDEWAAYQFDAAVYRFGVWARLRIEQRLPIFDAPAQPGRSRSEHGDPLPVLARLGKIKRGKVPASGVW